MNIAELKIELKELSSQIDILVNKRRDLQQKIAELSTTFKVGDRVTHDGAKYVWEIVAIRHGYGNRPKIIGAKIRKDGTPGVQPSEIYEPYQKPLRLAS